jgi:hypothetical protein
MFFGAEFFELKFLKKNYESFGEALEPYARGDLVPFQGEDQFIFSLFNRQGIMMGCRVPYT